MNLNKNIYYALVFGLLIGCPLALVSADPQPAPQVFRPAAIMIGGIKSAVAALQQEIDQLENEAVGVPTLKEDLASQNQKLSSTKNKLGISPIEQQLATLDDQLDQYAQQFFKSAQLDSSYLYYSLNGKLTDLLNDPRIIRRIQQIIQIKQEISDIMTQTLSDIKTLGDQINALTREDQKAVSSLLVQKINLEKQLQTLTKSSQAKEQLQPINQKLADIQSKIDRTLALRFTEDRINLIESYKDRMRQYQLMLNYLRDPESIPLTTEQQIIATE